MELCASRAVSNVLLQRFFNPNPPRLDLIQSSSLKRLTISHRSSGLLRISTPWRRAATEDTSTLVDDQVEDGPNGLMATKKNATEEKSATQEESIQYEVKPIEVVAEDESAPPTGEQLQPFQFLDGLNFQELLQLDSLDSEDAYPILIYGSGALVALWLASAVVGAVDSIPVVPKVLELVGLSYTIWFSSRYLIFKKNREEFFDKIAELKREVLGQSDD